jgi:hypothetical protein
MGASQTLDVATSLSELEDSADISRGGVRVDREVRPRISSERPIFQRLWRYTEQH